MGARILSAVGKTLIGAGVVLLLFVGYQLWGTGLEQAGHQNDLAAELGQMAGTTGDSGDLDAIAASLAEVDTATAPALPPPPNGEPVGIIEIPKIGVQQVMVQGVSKSDLKKGPGHYPGTPLPGQGGNAGVAGHRTTYGAPFNRIDELTPGDEIIASTPQGRFRYEVVAPFPGSGIEQGPGWFSVRPSQVTVLDPTEDDVITLTACHPKRSARQRIIVRAKLIEEPAKAAPPVVTAGDEVVAEESPDALFAGDPTAKWPALGFGVAALAVFLLAGFAGRRWWKPWAAYLLSAPVVGVLRWFCFYNVAPWLPSF